MVLLGAFLAWGLPRLRTSGGQALSDRILKLEEHVFSAEQKQELFNRLKACEMRIDFIRETQRDFHATIEQALMEDAHSPHTPELDRLLDKRKTNVLADDEILKLIRTLSSLIEIEQDRAKLSTYRTLRAVVQAGLRARQREKKLLASV